MKLIPQSSLPKEGCLLLFESSLSSIPFNMVVGTILCLELLYNKVDVKLVSLWLILIYLISITRWFYSKFNLKTNYYVQNPPLALLLFLFFTTLMGIIWAGGYFVLMSYLTGSLETVYLLVLGGLSAGAMTSLAVYLPAYYTYIISMFLPIIIYNFFILSHGRGLLAFMCLVFVCMIIMAARISSRLLQTTFRLGKEQSILINELTLTNLKLEKSIAEVRAMSITDSLTSLFNRRYFDMIFHTELNRAKRDKHSINLVFIDIDNFKYINDTFGHPSGDEFLIFVGNLLKQSLQRPNDTVFRLGGDEFAAILVNMTSTEVIQFCSHIQEAFNKSNQYQNVTLSMGIISIATFNVLNKQEIITAADKILYQAKKAGKNQIMSKLIV